MGGAARGVRRDQPSRTSRRWRGAFLRDGAHPTLGRRLPRLRATSRWSSCCATWRRTASRATSPRAAAATSCGRSAGELYGIPPRARDRQLERAGVRERRARRLDPRKPRSWTSSTTGRRSRYGSGAASAGGRCSPAATRTATSRCCASPAARDRPALAPAGRARRRRARVRLRQGRRARARAGEPDAWTVVSVKNDWATVFGDGRTNGGGHAVRARRGARRVVGEGVGGVNASLLAGACDRVWCPRRSRRPACGAGGARSTTTRSSASGAACALGAPGDASAGGFSQTAITSGRCEDAAERARHVALAVACALPRRGARRPAGDDARLHGRDRRARPDRPRGIRPVLAAQPPRVLGRSGHRRRRAAVRPAPRRADRRAAHARPRARRARPDRGSPSCSRPSAAGTSRRRVRAPSRYPACWCSGRTARSTRRTSARSAERCCTPSTPGPAQRSSCSTRRRSRR